MSDIPLGQILKHPNLTLYTFHLRHDGDRPQTTQADNASEIWQQLASIGKQLKVSELTNIKQHLRCYRDNKYCPVEGTPALQSLLSNPKTPLSFHLNQKETEGNSTCDGHFSAYIINNTYATELTLGYETPITIDQINRLNPQSVMFPSIISTAIGKTLVLYVEVDGHRREDQSIAENCIVKLFQDQTTCPEFVASSQFLASSFFEYDTLAIDPVDRNHILVWLNHGQPPQETNELSEALFHSFLSRHKVLQAYHQSQQCNDRAKEIYRQLESIAENLEDISQAPDRLQQFKALLHADLPRKNFQYHRAISSLSKHSNTISINLSNYRQQAQRISLLTRHKLSFLEEFAELAQNNYLAQTQVDLNYLTSGQLLAQQLVETIRGITEIEQAEISQHIETAVQVLGVALATGAIVSAGYSYIQEPFEPLFSTNVLHPFIVYLLVNACFVAPVGGLVYCLNRFVIAKRRLYRRKEKYKIKNRNPE